MRCSKTSSEPTRSSRVLNLLLLLCIAFIPFPTAVLAEFVRDDDQALTATIAYGTTFLVTGIAFNALWLYARFSSTMIDEHVSAARVRSRTYRYLWGPPLYVVGLLLAFVSPWLALGFWSSMTVFFLLPLNE